MVDNLNVQSTGSTTIRTLHDIDDTQYPVGVTAYLLETGVPNILMLPVASGINDQASGIVTTYHGVLNMGYNATNDSWDRIRGTKDDGLQVDLGHNNQIRGESPFGEVITGLIKPSVQNFAKRFNDERIWIKESGNVGDFIALSGMCELSTGTIANDYSELKSVSKLNYKPGESILSRFTAAFPTGGVASSMQFVGLGHKEDRIGVGFDGTDFSVIHKYHAKLEIQELTITNPAGGAETATITLNGTAHSVSVSSGTNAGTAKEVADYVGGVYQDSGARYETIQVDEKVYFVRQKTGDVAGTFSYSAITSTGSFSEYRAGGAGTEETVPQSSFSIDPLDGTGPSQITLDTSVINIFQVQFGWLGVGGILFSIADPNQQKFWPFHFKQWAGTSSSTIPHLYDPRLQFIFNAESKGSTTDIRLDAVCAMIGEVGSDSKIIGPRVTNNARNTSLGTTATPLLSMINTTVNLDSSVADVNRATIIINEVFAQNAGSTRDAEFNIYLTHPSGLTDSNFQSNDQYSLVLYDDSATAINTGLGQNIASFAVPPVSHYNYVLNPPLKLEAGELLVIAANTDVGTTDVLVSINGYEDI